MFSSFFPTPKLFFISVLLWSAFLIIIWYTLGEDIGLALGFDLGAPQTVIGLAHFTTQEYLWFDTFFILGVLSIYFFWNYFNKHRWMKWSILGSALLIFLSYT